MNDLVKKLLDCGKPMPILSFPSVSLTGKSVYELTHSADAQAEGIAAVQKRCDCAAAVTVMDLSVEAEAFGAKISAPENEVATVVGALISDEDEAEALAVPEVFGNRTGIFVEAVKKAKALITDRPLLAGIIGPFSLAGRLMDVSEALVNCIADPDFVVATLEKTTPFLINYAKAFKEAGADGIIIAEPLSGLLSPKLEAEFSAPYIKELTEAVQSENFAVVYHNCGPNTPLMTESFKTFHADIYHFGDAVDITVMLDKMADCTVSGNISPVECFTGGTPEKMRASVAELCSKTEKYNNFLLSSGCDIPPQAPWENIDEFFRAARDGLAGRRKG